MATPIISPVFSARVRLSLPVEYLARLSQTLRLYRWFIDMAFLAFQRWVHGHPQGWPRVSTPCKGQASLRPQFTITCFSPQIARQRFETHRLDRFAGSPKNVVKTCRESPFFSSDFASPVQQISSQLVLAPLSAVSGPAAKFGPQIQLFARLFVWCYGLCSTHHVFPWSTTIVT